MTVPAATRWPVLVWLAAMIACFAVLTKTDFTTDLSAFLPRSPTPVQQVLVEQLRDGVVSRLILIGIEGGAPAALAQTSRKLAAEMRKARESFTAVNNGEDTGAAADREFLWRNRYVLSPAVTVGHFSGATLRVALEDDLQLLGSPAGVLVRRILAQDPSGELLRLIEQFEQQARPATQDGVWFSRDGKRAVLVAQTRAAGYDIDAQERALALIESAFSKALAAEPGGAHKLLVTGPAVFAVKTRARIKDDALRFSVIATTLVALLLLAVYRSPRALLLGLLPVASGALAGIAAVSLGFGAVHGITLGFGATLIGEAVDYAIYLFTQITPGSTPADTLTRIWPTLQLGLLTSVCGFSAMLLAGFPGLAQLGLFSIAGLITAAAVTRYVLPALLPAGFTVRAATGIATGVTAGARHAPLLRYPLLLIALAGTLFLVMQHDHLWSDELASLSPIASSDRALDEQLRGDLGAPDVRHLVVINAAGADAALAASEKISAVLQRAVERGYLAGFESPAIYLPSTDTQRARQSAIPDSALLRASLQEAQRGLPFRPGVFEPFLRDAAAAKIQPLLTGADLRGTALGLKLDTLLVRRTAAGSDGWTAMVPLRGVTDAKAIARDVDQLPDDESIVVDLKRESDALYQSYRREVVLYSLLGTGAIVLLLLVTLRSTRRTVEVLMPLAAAVIVTFSILVLNGTALSIFHLVGLLLVVAVGSNYALFFERQAANAAERERTLVSLLFANFTTLIGFGLLAFSQVPILHAIGSTVGIGAVLSLAFSAILIGRTRAPAAARA
ncbi:MAG: MMPL family transporter [Burkholderiales bacterium]